VCRVVYPRVSVVDEEEEDIRMKESIVLSKCVVLLMNGQCYVVVDLVESCWSWNPKICCRCTQLL